MKTLLSHQLRNLVGVFAAACVVLTLFGCAGTGAPGSRTLVVYVVNDGDRPVENIAIAYGGDRMDVPYLEPGGEERAEFFLDPDLPLQVRYSARGENASQEYRIRALPENSGIIRLHFDREGELHPNERFFIDL